MGGQDGNRGYLVQTVIALLRSLEDREWETVAIEPDTTAEKVDVRWTHGNRIRAVQIKSSQNQIGKSDVERWASELKQACLADEYELTLVGPTAQSVAEMRSFDGVKIPLPKSLDLLGLLHEAAHLLSKFLDHETMPQQSPHQCELIVHALVTKLSLLSTKGTPFRRLALVGLLKEWIAPVALGPESPWEQVDFKPQRGIENAVAGKRLGPLDVDACPAFSICDEIVTELQRSHVREISGTSGCGKSITAWQVAKRFQGNGFIIWRPRASATADGLLSHVPASGSLIVVDDAHKFGDTFCSRLSELSSPERKVLLVSTVENPLLPQVSFISPEQCVRELIAAISNLGNSLLPIVQKYDNWIGSRAGEIPLQSRINDARKQKKPWEVFWIIRGGWKTAHREIEGLDQFPGAIETLLWIATAQIASCDAGVKRNEVIDGLRTVGIQEQEAGTVLRKLDQFHLITIDDRTRTKHLLFAYQIMQICFHSSRAAEWSRLAAVVTRCVLCDQWPLKGLVWLFGNGLGMSDAVRFKCPEFRALLKPLIERCVSESEDFGCAAGCASKLIDIFDLPHQEILTHADRWNAWATSGNALAAYFCGEIVNTLINKSPSVGGRRKAVLSQPLVDQINVNRLLEIVNALPLDDFYAVARLLDRMCFGDKPVWAPVFIERFNWGRIRSMILSASGEHAGGISAMIKSIVKLASSEGSTGLEYVEQIESYITRSVNESPVNAVRNMEDIIWWCLSYAPEFLMGGERPSARQKAIAERIVGGIEPRAVSTAMATVVSRDLEQLAWTVGFLRRVNVEMVIQVAKTLDERGFFAATTKDWKEQTGELQQLVAIFAIGKQFEPAASWIRANSYLFSEAMEPLFVALAPDVASSFYRQGKDIRLAARHNVKWIITAGAIAGLARVDREICKCVVREKFEELWSALYTLNLSSARYIIRVFRMIFELSPELFENFVSGINLDDDRCLKLVEQLRKNQPKERASYQKLAKCGTAAGGSLGLLSIGFQSRLDV